MASLDAELLGLAHHFGSSRGIRPFMIDERNLKDPKYCLVIVHADKLQAAYHTWVGEYRPESFSRVELEEKAAIEIEKGYHTYIAPIGGDAGGYLNREWITGMPAALEVMFHEGFHLRKRQTKLFSHLEESAAKVIGLYMAREFAMQHGCEELVSQVEKRFQDQEQYGVEFGQKVNTRLEELRAGKVITSTDTFNNAKLYFEYAYYGHYTLCRDVLRTLGTFRSYVELISGLPKNFTEGKLILREVSTAEKCRVFSL